MKIMGSVSLRNVNKSFGKVDVIRDVSLDIEEGEFCVLVGPSGSGKSTLLRIIAGLEDVTSGTVAIDEKDVTDLPPKLRDIAMVFQTYALYPQMTVRENMGFALRLAGMAKSRIAQKVEETARMLELDMLLERLPKELSGGQRQRVSMGAPSFAIHPFSCLTSRFPTLMPNCALRCGGKYPICTSA